MPGAFVTHTYATATALLAVDPDTAGFTVGTRARELEWGREYEVTGPDGSRVWSPVARPHFEVLLDGALNPVESGDGDWLYVPVED